MQRRRFLQGLAAGTLAIPSLDWAAPEPEDGVPPAPAPGSLAADAASTEGHTLLCSFARGPESWKVYEDLRTRDGVITFVSEKGSARVLVKTAEAVFADEGAPWLGLDLKAIGTTGRDLLADKLLAHGDPDEDEVRRAAPPMDSAVQRGPGWRLPWNTFVGTRACSDTMPVFAGGNTRTYHPAQFFHELTPESARKRHEGLLGGWMPAVRKVFPGDGESWFEALVFGDVLAHDRFIVQTWHRTALIRDGTLAKVEYGYRYPAYTHRRQPPKAEDFYRGLLDFAEYWERQMHDVVPITLPDAAWRHMTRYAFVKEQMVRPGGVYPKYGAVDRDYYGPEYDGFQDIFTMSLYANLECGRFTQAHDVLDEYFTEMVDAGGLVNMRGPETAQYGLTLSLLARYFDYTGDAALLRKHLAKIEATASLLEELHDESRRLPSGDRGYGLIHGWCESDSCLMPDPSVWWKPYFANSAWAVRGWSDLARVWPGVGSGGDAAARWVRRSRQLRAALIESVDANIRRDQNPPYLGPLPGTKLTVWESLQQEHPSEQQWAHRCYAELLQPGVLTEQQANLLIDSMRANGGTTIGVVANMERPHPQGRDILGFISYGYAEALLRLDRIEEYLLFLYAHRYHDHSRGSWTAGEVAGITGDSALFCIPAQQTIPLLVRWMLVSEDAETLCFGRALPRKWIAAGQPIAMDAAPTRWGRVNYRLEHRGENQLVAAIHFLETHRQPESLRVTFRLPVGQSLASIAVNGKSVAPGGRNKDAALIAPQGMRSFEVVAKMS
ncbi:MAG TPA: Tat pathway signal protein [Acidobacteriaceae bacterium]